MNSQSSIIESFYKAWLWLLAHPLGFWTALSTFFVALWSSMKDGAGWIESIFASFISVFVALGIVAVMRKSGLHEEWMPVVGMLLGLIGVDRIRIAARGAWDSRGKNISLADESDKPHKE